MSPYLRQKIHLLQLQKCVTLHSKNNASKSMKKTFLLWAVLFAHLLVLAQLPAFPGAEGHGRYTTGGRGGKVYFVTNLTDVNTGNSATREGSLRWCLGQTGVRTIVFRVGGTIWLNSPLSISRGDVTIAGQSAPGEGIAIAGHPVTISANNVILRYLRFRMGQERVTTADGADVLGSRRYKNIIIDHCSFSWSTDECVSLYEGENITLQWSIIAESLRLAKHSKGPHGYGGIWGGNKASFHHNLMAHNDSRTPRFGPGGDTQMKELTDMRNCVIYNWGGIGCYGAEAMNVNIVNNYYKPGPATSSGTARARIIAIDKKTALPVGDTFYPINDKWGKFFIEGNIVDASTSSSSSDKAVCNNATNDNWNHGVLNQINASYGITATEKAALKVSEAFDPGIVTTHTAETAYQKVLAYAGASLYRDTHDARIVDETRSGTAAFKGLSPYNGLGTVTYPAGTVIGTTTLTTTTTINWKSTSYPKKGIIDSETDLRPSDATGDWSAWPVLADGTPETDADGDGIKDGWLEQYFPGKTANDVNDEGYTLLEVYLNSLVEAITTDQNREAIASAVQSSSFSNPKVKIQLLTDSQILKFDAEHVMSKIRIADVSGRMLRDLALTTNSYELNISPFPTGVYLVQVNFNGEYYPYVAKIMKQSIF